MNKFQLDFFAKFIEFIVYSWKPKKVTMVFYTIVIEKFDIIEFKLKTKSKYDFGMHFNNEKNKT